MRNTNVLIISFTLLAAIFNSCNQNNKSEDKGNSLVEKENELLKKENELLRKEQELIQKSSQITEENSKKESDLDFMKNLKGQYPLEVKLLDNSKLKKRLQKLLGSQYDFMKSIWQVQSPIEIENGLFYAWGMQARSGGDPSAVLMVDFNKNVLYVGIRENSKEKLYAEDGTSVPQKIQDWADEDM